MSLKHHGISVVTLFLTLTLLLSLLPMATVRGQGTVQLFNPVADATVSSESAKKNFGAQTTLSVDGSPEINSYLTFDVRGLNGAQVSSAKLRFYVVDDSHSGFDVSQVNNNWSETKIAYRNAPALGSRITSTGGYGVDQWIEVDVTGVVRDEGVFSFALSTGADTTTAVASRETGATAPQLVLSLGSPVMLASPTATTVFIPAVTNTPMPPQSPTDPPPSTQPMPYGNLSGNWVLKFADDFNNGSLDLNKWQPNWLAGNDTAITKPINGYEESCYDPAQVSVSGGYLKLSAVARKCTANNGVTYNYASGLVNSRQDFTFTYGYAEARVWLDGSTTIKNWPAFWINGTGQWPTTGEIDIFEGLEGKPSWHYHYGSTSNPQQIGGYPTLSSKTGWHVFAANWEPGKITYYYDGVQVGQVTSNVVSSPMYVILNYGLSTYISPPIQVPSYFLVDYVRVWQK